MPPMPEIDTVGIRARAEAARIAVATMICSPGSDSYVVISASLADVDALLVAFTAAAKVGRQQEARLEQLRGDARRQTGPMLELAVATLRQVLGSFTRGGSRGNGLTTWADVSPALLAEWRRALLALDAAESFYRGARPPTADVELLRREINAMVPVVEAARDVVRADGPIPDSETLLGRLVTAVVELDGPGSGARIDVGASDAVPEGPVEGRPGIGDPGGQARVFAVAKEWLAFAGLNLSWSPADPADMAALRQAAIDAGSGGLSVIAADALSVELLVPEIMTAAEHRAMELTAELAKLMRHEIIAEGPAWRNDHREFMADLHHIQHRILKQAAARAYPDLYRLLGGWPDVDGGDHA